MDKFLQMIVAMHTRITTRDTERGATATEYALLVGLIALVIVAGVTIFGNALNDFFTSLGDTVTSWLG